MIHAPFTTYNSLLSITCQWKKYLGVECPGCGLTRSFVELIHGNWILSFKLFPALVPMMLLIIVATLHIFLKFKNGYSVLKFLALATGIIMVLHYILKVVPNLLK